MQTPADSFQAREPDRRVSRLTVHGWAARPDPELERAIAYVTTFEHGNQPPAVLGDGDRRHLAWRGAVTGGALTLYEQLAPALAGHDLDASFADARLEAFVPAIGPVVLLAEDGRRVALDRDEFERRIELLDRGGRAEDLFVTPDRGDPAREEADPGRTAWLEALTARVACAEVTIVERFDPDGFLEEAWSTCQVLGWRVEFLTPGTCRGPEDSLETCLVWRVAEWEWAAGADGHQLGRWRLRERRAVEAREVAAALPDALATWVARATAEGIELCQALVDGGEAHFAGARLRLRAELAALDR